MRTLSQALGWVRLAVAATVLVPSAALAAPCVWDGGGDGWNWFDGNNWNPDSVPAVGDSATVSSGTVILTNSTAALASAVISNATLVFTNYGPATTIALIATTVNIQNNATLTHSVNTATSTNAAGQWVPDGRVFVQCTNLIVDAGGQINADVRGYQGTNQWVPGCGPGGGQAGNPSGAGGYGGNGGSYNAGYGVTYGSVAAPADPGSGAGGSSAQGDFLNGGGTGGGQVQIAAANAVVVNGTITANGGIGKLHYGAGGSGGGIYITCRTFTGANGVMRADGGRTGDYGGHGGGGGRIAIIYDPAAQAGVAPKPAVTLSAAHCRGNYAQNSLPGSVYVPDTVFYPYETLNASAFITIPGLTNWAPSSLTMNDAWIRIPSLVGFAVTNDVKISGSTGRLDLVNRPVLTCRNLTLTNGASLVVYPSPTNSGTPAYGALVALSADMVVCSNCWVYPYSDVTNGGSVLFRMRDLVVRTTNAGFNANVLGWAGGRAGINGGLGYGPGASAQFVYSGGAGYGGVGGVGNAGVPGGPTYGSSNAPALPGSGSANDTGSNGGGGAGGGLIWIDAARIVTLNGGMTANGQNAPGNYAGGGSGGGIYIKCRVFEGSGGVLSARGGNYGSYTSGGGGAGGRIAVWRVTDRYEGAAATDVSGGIGVNNGAAGTVVWGLLAAPGTLITLK